MIDYVSKSTFYPPPSRQIKRNRL